jgi:hypothetical protein
MVNEELATFDPVLPNGLPNGFALGAVGIGVEPIPKPPRFPKLSSFVQLASGASSSISTSSVTATSKLSFFPLTLSEVGIGAPKGTL